MEINNGSNEWTSQRNGRTTQLVQQMENQTEYRKNKHNALQPQTGTKDTANPLQRLGPTDKARDEVSRYNPPTQTAMATPHQRNQLKDESKDLPTAQTEDKRSLPKESNPTLQRTNQTPCRILHNSMGQHFQQSSGNPTEDTERSTKSNPGQTEVDKDRRSTRTNKDTLH